MITHKRNVWNSKSLHMEPFQCGKCTQRAWNTANKKNLQRNNAKCISPDTMAFIIHHIYLNRTFVGRAHCKRNAMANSLESIMALPIKRAHITLGPLLLLLYYVFSTHINIINSCRYILCTSLKQNETNACPEPTWTMCNGIMITWNWRNSVHEMRKGNRNRNQNQHRNSETKQSVSPHGQLMQINQYTLFTCTVPASQLIHSFTSTAIRRSFGWILEFVVQ